MKHLKAYENVYPISKELLTEYKGKVYINIPSEIYFKSTVKFHLVFVDEVYQHKNSMPYGEGYQYTYVIKGDAFKRTEINYEDNYSIINWNQEYNIDDFNHIKFMTTKEFYNKYKDSYEKIIEILYEKKLNNKLSDFGRKPYEDMIDKLILPETQYLIKSKSFNL